MAETIHSFQVLTGSLFLFCFVLLLLFCFCFVLFCFVCETCGLERNKAMFMAETIHSFQVLTAFSFVSETCGFLLCFFKKRKFLFLFFLFQVVTAAASNLLFDENGKPRTLGPNFAGNPTAAKPILAAAPVPKQIKVLPEV